MANFTFSIQELRQRDETGAQQDSYILSEEIVNAVKAAISLEQPLFITGEPGTGKTRLAYKIAQHFQLTNEKGEFGPLIFNTKTTSTARDLFYLYDAVRHFRDANLKEAKASSILEYIDLQALGKAIALTNPKAAKALGMEVKQARHTVVLIDEIDKAPTDFPNDILFEIENMAFEIKETGTMVESGQGGKPLVIMTSNSEKSLPDAFLRRCVFLHIEFPKADLLQEIVQSKFGTDSPYSDMAFVKHFEAVREAVKKKRPATAELIGWLRMLRLEKFLDAGNDALDFNQLSPQQKNILRFSYGVLAKNKDDLSILEQRFL
jgi:MoxR-like ATPase